MWGCPQEQNTEHMVLGVALRSRSFTGDGDGRGGPVRTLCDRMWNLLVACPYCGVRSCTNKYRSHDVLY
jgi:hypothetical protein